VPYSRTTAPGSLSGRSLPGWCRSRPSGVHSPNATSPTSSGRTQCASSRPWPEPRK
jgi:hypothetical protein